MLAVLISVRAARNSTLIRGLFAHGPVHLLGIFRQFLGRDVGLVFKEGFLSAGLAYFFNEFFMPFSG